MKQSHNQQWNKISQLQNLRKIDLDFSDMIFESDDITMLAYMLSQANGLKQLHLQFDQSSLNNQSLVELGSILKKLQNLNSFQFSALNSLFTEKGIISLCESLLNCFSLKIVKINIEQVKIYKVYSLLPRSSAFLQDTKKFKIYSKKLKIILLLFIQHKIYSQNLLNLINNNLKGQKFQIFYIYLLIIIQEPQCLRAFRKVIQTFELKVLMVQEQHLLQNT
ncbi:hypothetical protein TTHERM_000091489 (macronuclear) [Tetrahymena thermophila SB210]|uniref:Uncharacterized protein n=1 Tax=Tetrahymena thermophila (strain SB210) TaxID=312017 RepID=W7XKT4_TETTS|nr:hypothetical protein TTHERM_000091489 [Tetrahymena thermophila SB210]EWS75199.1 hypothetical protein TTHERM_000091489 [Tetrahymena thermophila SB210]|eukprot:XP_012652190.1 hypothetical protein TTHERM_000091489 [Tetrahymena thermophila SB210]